MPLEHWFRTIPLRVRSLCRRRRVDQELAEELEDHLEHRTDALVRSGLSRIAIGVGAAIDHDVVRRVRRSRRRARDDGHLRSALISGLVACYLPARRAMRVDPLLALRAE